MRSRTWWQLFDITNTTYHELTLEFLATFEFELGMINFDRPGTILFLAFGSMLRLSLTEFSVHLGLYDEVFTHTPEYDALLIE